MEAGVGDVVLVGKLTGETPVPPQILHGLVARVTGLRRSLLSNVSLNLVVIRSPDIERACRFYSALGLVFTKHAHGTGPEHYACEMNGFVFEVYPRTSEGDSTSAVRLGFRVRSVDAAVAALVELGAKVVSPSKESPWGRRAVVDDLDGHRVELTEPIH